MYSLKELLKKDKRIVDIYNYVYKKMHPYFLRKKYIQKYNIDKEIRALLEHEQQDVNSLKKY